MLVHHLLDLGGSRHVENFFEAEVFADDLSYILTFLALSSEALNEVALEERQPVVLSVAEIIDRYVEAVRNVVLIAVDLIVDYDTIPELPVTLAPCEKVQVLNFMALLIRRAMLPRKHVGKEALRLLLVSLIVEFL